MNGHDVGTGGGKLGEDGLGSSHKKVHVKQQRCAESCNKSHANRKRRRHVAIHDVDVNERSPGCLNPIELAAEVEQICGENADAERRLHR